jgi:hypothetical protein
VPGGDEPGLQLEGLPARLHHTVERDCPVHRHVADDSDISGAHDAAVRQVHDQVADGVSRANLDQLDVRGTGSELQPVVQGARGRRLLQAAVVVAAEVRFTMGTAT